MQAEIIAVGSELLTAERIDTNSLYLTDQLNGLGVEVTAKHVVGDDRARLAEAVRAAASRVEIVILTGGLGPTEDDVTRDAVADTLDRKLVFHEEIQRQMEERFRRLGRRLAAINSRQAFILEGADILPNDRGTAPGQWIDDSGRSIVLLPGPPHELQAMFERQCLSRLARRVPQRVIRTVTLRVAGMTESGLDELIAPVYKKFENPVTTVLAGGGDIQVIFRSQAATEAEATGLLAEVAGPVEALLGSHVYSRNGDPLEVVVGGMLGQVGMTLAVAESCTGGMLAERITQVPGSSAYFSGGFITYTNRMKTELLGVGPDLLKEFGAVSTEAAEAMAKGARRRTGASMAVSVTGVAGPDGGTEATPVGTVFVGVADAAGCRVNRRQLLGDRTRVRMFATHMALDVIRLRLAGL